MGKTVLVKNEKVCTNVAGTVSAWAIEKFKKCENGLCHMTLSRRATSPPLFSNCKLLAISSALDRNGPRASAVKLEAQLLFIIIYLQSQQPESSSTATITQLEHNKHIRLLYERRKRAGRDVKHFRKRNKALSSLGLGLAPCPGKFIPVTVCESPRLPPSFHELLFPTHS